MRFSKEELKKWLKGIGKDRFWLAEQCGGVDKRTVDSWFFKSSKIPAKAQLIIESLMSSDSLSNDDKVDSDLEISLEFVGATAELVKGFMEKHPEISLENYAQVKIVELCAGIEKAKTQSVFSPRSSSTIQKPYKIEVWGNIAAGGLMDGSIDSAFEVQTAKKYPAGHYALRVNGPSMEPTIFDGSLVVVKEYKETELPKVGSIVVYYDGRGVTLKRLAKVGEDYALSSDNPKFSDIEPMPGEGSISALFVEVLE